MKTLIFILIHLAVTLCGFCQQGKVTATLENSSEKNCLENIGVFTDQKHLLEPSISGKFYLSDDVYIVTL